MLEHAVDRVQQFAHRRNQGLHFAFSLGQQMLIESAQVRLMTHGDQSGHVQGPAQVSIARLLMRTFLWTELPD